VLSSLAAVAAGCGGSGSARLSKSDYQKQLKTIGNSLSATANGIGSLNPTDLKVAIAALNKLAGVFDTAVAKVSKLKAPKDIEAAQTSLVAALKNAAAEMRSYATKVKTTTLANAQGLAKQLQNVTSSAPFKQIQAAIKEYQTKGYAVG
jgi:hypothetical protein